MTLLGCRDDILETVAVLSLLREVLPVPFVLRNIDTLLKDIFESLVQLGSGDGSKWGY